MRPSGRPPTPSARSTASEPVESVSTFILALVPRRMIEPSPNSFEIAESASSMFFSRTCAAGEEAGLDSDAFAGAALDMALRGDIVDALILDRRDSKVPNYPRFLAGNVSGKAAGGRGSRPGSVRPARRRSCRWPPGRLDGSARTG